MKLQRDSDGLFKAARIGAIAAGLLAMVRCTRGGAGAMLEPPGTLLLTFVVATVIAAAVFALRQK